MAQVIETWCREIETLGKQYPYVQVFENKGSAMGCSNPHPHGQIWATSFQPNEHAKESRAQLEYYQEHGTSMLLDYAKAEVEDGQRVVECNADWVVVVPIGQPEHLKRLCYPALRWLDCLNSIAISDVHLVAF